MSNNHNFNYGFYTTDVRGRRLVLDELEKALSDAWSNIGLLAGGVEGYISVYAFQDGEFMQRARETGKTAGCTDAVWVPNLIVDFDNKDDLEAARKAACKLVDALVAYGLDAGCVQIWWSGFKGFNVCTSIRAFGEVIPSQLIPAITRRVAESIAEACGVEIDTKIYDIARVVRAGGTINPKSGLYKSQRHNLR